MKKIYIVFIASDYKTGRFIRFLTHATYNHVAISFTPGLSKFYSFARLNYYEPLSAGYQIESPYRYIKNSKCGTEIEVCEVKLSDEKYKRIINKIKEYNSVKDKTLYNYCDILGYPFKKHFKLKYAHTCVSFVQELLEQENFISISKFEKKLRSKAIFRGNILDYCKQYKTEKRYFDRNPRRKKYKRYAFNIGRLVKRTACYGTMVLMQLADKII